MSTLCVAKLARIEKGKNQRKRATMNGKGQEGANQIAGFRHRSARRSLAENGRSLKFLFP
jgi:hypothetical protein